MPVSLRPTALSVRMLMLLGMALIIFGGVVGAATAHFAGAPGVRLVQHQYVRALTVQAHLDQIEGDYILAAGDSHVESWLVGSLCGLPVVNAGLSGATLADYTRFLDMLTLPRPPRGVVLTIGTNDTYRKRIDSLGSVAGRFADGLRALLARFSSKATSIVATGLPPLDATRATAFSPQMAERLTAEVEAACTAAGCRFVAPFGQTAHVTDGVHLANYAAAYRTVEEPLCAAIQ